MAKFNIKKEGSAWLAYMQNQPYEDPNHETNYPGFDVKYTGRSIADLYRDVSMGLYKVLSKQISHAEAAVSGDGTFQNSITVSQIGELLNNNFSAEFSNLVEELFRKSRLKEDMITNSDGKIVRQKYEAAEQNEILKRIISGTENSLLNKEWQRMLNTGIADNSIIKTLLDYTQKDEHRPKNLSELYTSSSRYLGFMFEELIANLLNQHLKEMFPQGGIKVIHAGGTKEKVDLLLENTNNNQTFNLSLKLPDFNARTSSQLTHSGITFHSGSIHLANLFSYLSEWGYENINNLNFLNVLSGLIFHHNSLPKDHRWNSWPMGKSFGNNNLFSDVLAKIVLSGAIGDPKTSTLFPSMANISRNDVHYVIMGKTLMSKADILKKIRTSEYSVDYSVYNKSKSRGRYYSKAFYFGNEGENTYTLSAIDNIREQLDYAGFRHIQFIKKI